MDECGRWMSADSSFKKFALKGEERAVARGASGFTEFKGT